MGRTEPSHAPSAHQGFRKDQRAKNARATVNKTVPQILASDSRARKGIEKAHLFTNIPPDSDATSSSPTPRAKSKALRSEKNARNNKALDLSEDDKLDESTKVSSEVDPEPCQIKIYIADTLTAAHRLHKQKKSKQNVAILNMASPLRPGGGVLNGATSQEESICARTTLLSSLKEEWYRLPDVGGIWSPDVLVFRLPGANGDEDIPKTERFYVDVVSSAMTRFPDIIERSVVTENDDDKSGDDHLEVEKIYASQKDRDLALEKMRAVLRKLESQNTEQVVLGAWGCGAYGNPTREICAAWKKALLGTRSSGSKSKGRGPSLGSIKEVVFAIKEANMAQDFARFWGNGMEVSEVDARHQKTTDVTATEQEAEDLTHMIDTLQLQITQAKTPMLQQGLRNTLQALKMQHERMSSQSLDVNEDNSSEE